MRFVQPEDAAYVRNLAALWAVDPELAERIECTEPEAAYRVEASKAGPPTLAVENAPGRWVYLHSRHHPADEGRRLAEPADTDQHVVFYVHGFGLGYHVEALFERASSEAVLCVFEADLTVLRLAMEARDLSAVISSRRLLIFTTADKADLLVRLTRHSAMITLGTETLVHSPSYQRHKEFHDQITVWLEEFASYFQTGMNTLVLNGRRTAENIARNLGWYVATPGLQRLRDRYPKAPAVIVSAGPSLRKNKHLLKRADGKAVIIAVQTTLQPLLELGVRPHFVTSLDYHDICTRFFEKLPADLRTELVAEPKASSAIFGLHPGPLTILGNEFADNLLREMRLDQEKARIQAGATVAHLAYYLAEHLGCDPIIFVGQDLGFSDGLCYTPGTSYEDVWRPELSRFCTLEMKQWEQIVRDRHILRKIPDYAGRPMYTEERLFTYLQQFERDFARTDRKVIDATEGGALKRGAEAMTLADALDRYCARELPRVADDYPPPRWERVADVAACLRNRRSEAAEVEAISRETLPLLEEVRDHIEDQARVNRAIAKIDALRARMNGLGPCYDLILQLTQLSEMNRFQQDRRIAASRVGAAERQRRQVGRDVANVRAMADAAAEFQKLMGDVIDRLEAGRGVAA